MFGPDVSDWQGAVDWFTVAGAGCGFGVTKATEGTGNVQETLEANRAGMAVAGMAAIGLYHFARPENGNPVAQAIHFLDTIGPLRPREFVVLDVETGDLSTWAGFIDQWCSYVASQLDTTPVVYMSESPAGSMPPSCARWPLWVAGYVPSDIGRGWPRTWDDDRITDVGPWARQQLVAWQYTSGANLPGIGGRCDMNIAPDDLPARLGLGTPLTTTAKENAFMALNTTQQEELYETMKATNAAVARLETAILDPATGLGMQVRQLRQELDGLAARLNAAPPAQP